MNYNRYEPDWELADELGLNPEANYDELREHFIVYVDKGLLETVPARLGQTEPRFRFTVDTLWDIQFLKAREDIWKKVQGDGFPIDCSILVALGAYDGAAWSIYDYGKLESEQKSWSFPVKPV